VFSLPGSISSLNAVNLVTPPPVMLNGGEGMASIPSEYVNTGMNGTSGQKKRLICLF
jgi:hypothetical protein